MVELDPEEQALVSRWPLALAVVAGLGLLLYLLEPILRHLRRALREE